MKLEDAVERVRLLIFTAVDKYLSRMGLLPKKSFPLEKVSQELQAERRRMDDILENLSGEVGADRARDKLIDELSFTLFNRIAGVKVLEAHELIPEVFTRREVHGGHSFGHKLWLERQALVPRTSPSAPFADGDVRSTAADRAVRGTALDGLREYIRHAFTELSAQIHLYAPDYLYDLLPEVFDLNAIIEEVNRIEREDWRSDDIMGWLYEYYNRSKRAEFKASGAKIEYDRVPLTSQVYTPRWVVEFLLNNSLGKLWLEGHPQSSLKERHDIALPQEPTPDPSQEGNKNRGGYYYTRTTTPTHPPNPSQEGNSPTPNPSQEGNKNRGGVGSSGSSPLLGGVGGGFPQSPEQIKVLDPAMGSGNFLLYAFDLLAEMYAEEGYSRAEIPRLILERNLYGIDLDDRAVQIAQLGLYIKALKYLLGINPQAQSASRLKPAISNSDKQDASASLRFETGALALGSLGRMNLVSTDFYLPPYDEVQDFFTELTAHTHARALIQEIWDDLRLAHKFGSLIRIEERIQARMETLEQQQQIDWERLDANWQREALGKIKAAVETCSRKRNGNARFFRSKTLDSLAFVEILLNKFDVVVANPPYTSSRSYGKELIQFIEKNYKRPLAFHYNLYAVFLKRASELINEFGKIGIIHPLTFMYIKSYEDMRKFILDNFHIHLLVEYGYGELFGDIMVDPVFYVLEKGRELQESIFISMNQYTGLSQENIKREKTKKALHLYLSEDSPSNVYLLDQRKLKQIESYPFIYWISDKFREKFQHAPLKEYTAVKTGLSTGDNLQFIRFWWEIALKKNLSERKQTEKWVALVKGGAYNKWYGNIWLTVNWEQNGSKIRNFPGALIRSEEFYFIEGITYSKTSMKGSSFRNLPPNCIFEAKGCSIFLTGEANIDYILALVNSSLTNYIVNCLNSTVETNVGDLQRVPFVHPPKELEDEIARLASRNVEIKKHLCEFSIIEMNYAHNPLLWAKAQDEKADLAGLLKRYFDYENRLIAEVLQHEAAIDALIFEVYQLSDADRRMVLEKEGVPAGSLPGMSHRDTEDTEEEKEKQDSVSSVSLWLIPKIEELYKRSQSLEEISAEVGVNPLSVAQILEQSRALPEKRCFEIVRDLLIDTARAVLQQDDDGILPLVEYAGEETVQRKVYAALIARGFSDAQIGQFKRFLGRDLNSYLEQHFFKDLADRLNLFMYLPKTPFIWHLSSGPLRGFEAFVLIYPWTRDKLMRLRSVYVEKRESSLKNRRLDLAQEDSISAKQEQETLTRQLEEIAAFKQKIDELLQAGYNPKLDDGVGKNIAPLQQKNLLKCSILKHTELQKYLNADW